MKNFTKLALVLGMTTASMLSQTGTASARDGDDIFAGFNAQVKKLSSAPNDQSGSKKKGGGDANTNESKSKGGKPSGSKKQDDDMFASFTLPTFSSTASNTNVSKGSKKAEERLRKERDALKKEKVKFLHDLAVQEEEVKNLKQANDVLSGSMERFAEITTVYNTDVATALQIMIDVMNTAKAGSGERFVQGFAPIFKKAAVNPQKPTDLAEKGIMTGVFAAYQHAKKGDVEATEIDVSSSSEADEPKGGKKVDKKASESSRSEEDNDASKSGADVSEENSQSDDGSEEVALVRNVNLIASVAKIPNEDGFQLPGEAFRKYLGYFRSLNLKGVDGLDEETANAAKKLSAVLKRGPKVDEETSD